MGHWEESRSSRRVTPGGLLAVRSRPNVGRGVDIEQGKTEGGVLTVPEPGRRSNLSGPLRSWRREDPSGSPGVGPWLGYFGEKDARCRVCPFVPLPGPTTIISI